MKATRGALLATPLTAAALARPAWPSRTIRLIVPFAPGGALEIPARFLAERPTQSLGQPVIVETRGRAGRGVAGRAGIKPE